MKYFKFCYMSLVKTNLEVLRIVCKLTFVETNQLLATR